MNREVLINLINENSCGINDAEAIADRILGAEVCSLSVGALIKKILKIEADREGADLDIYLDELPLDESERRLLSLILGE